MTREDKDLLLKDLCARLPYGVIIETPKGKGHVCDINLTIFGTDIGVNISATSRDRFNIEDCKPYLFPLSSMTTEQREEYHNLCSINVDKCGNIIYSDTCESVDYLNENKFDYRYLISMGLAIDATELNIY